MPWSKKPINNPGKRLGGIRSGFAAVRNRTGIHALPHSKIRENSLKGNETFKAKWQNPEYQKLHKDKIRFGRLLKKWSRIRKPVKDFGFH